MTDEKDDEFYMRRLDAGLFVLQLLDYIMIDISATGSSTVSLIHRLNNNVNNNNIVIKIILSMVSFNTTNNYHRVWQRIESVSNECSVTSLWHRT